MNERYPARTTEEEKSATPKERTKTYNKEGKIEKITKSREKNLKNWVSFRKTRWKHLDNFCKTMTIMIELNLHRAP